MLRRSRSGPNAFGGSVRNSSRYRFRNSAIGVVGSRISSTSTAEPTGAFESCRPDVMRRSQLCDPVDALVAGLVRDEILLELLLDHAGKEATHRMLLPAGCLHESGDGRALRLPKHSEDSFLLRRRAGQFNRCLFGRGCLGYG